LLEEFRVVINIRDKELLISFGKHLRVLRKMAGFSQERLANEADISLSQVSRLERGLLNPTLCTLNAIAKAMKISLEKIVNF